jgi:hypothetical protein
MKRQIEAHGKKLEIMHSQHEEVMLAALDSRMPLLDARHLVVLSLFSEFRLGSVHIRKRQSREQSIRLPAPAFYMKLHACF